MDDRGNFPDTNRLSVLLAIILLTYACLPYINVPTNDLTINILGVTLNYSLNIVSLIYVILALLAGVGIEWLLSDHPHPQRKNTYQHFLLPVLTTWALSIPLNSIEVGLEWWVVYALGAIMLTLVFISEYIVVDFMDNRYNLASITLTAISFALFLVIAISIRALDLRLYLLLPAMVFPLMLICMRVLFLGLQGHKFIEWSFVISLIVGQMLIGFHYLPMRPQTFGLIIVGFAYALATLVISIENNKRGKSIWLEPITIIMLFSGLAMVI